MASVPSATVNFQLALSTATVVLPFVTWAAATRSAGCESELENLRRTLSVVRRGHPGLVLRSCEP